MAACPDAVGAAARRLVFAEPRDSASMPARTMRA
jgi:hypothetical protein